MIYKVFINLHQIPDNEYDEVKEYIEKVAQELDTTCIILTDTPMDDRAYSVKYIEHVFPFVEGEYEEACCVMATILGWDVQTPETIEIQLYGKTKSEVHGLYRILMDNDFLPAMMMW